MKGYHVGQVRYRASIEGGEVRVTAHTVTAIDAEGVTTLHEPSGMLADESERTLPAYRTHATQVEAIAALAAIRAHALAKAWDDVRRLSRDVGLLERSASRTAGVRREVSERRRCGVILPQCLDVLKGGPMRGTDIARAIGRTQGAVHRTLTRSQDVRQRDDVKWELVPADGQETPHD